MHMYIYFDDYYAFNGLITLSFENAGTEHLIVEYTTLKGSWLNFCSFLLRFVNLELGTCVVGPGSNHKMCIINITFYVTVQLK